MTDRSINVFIKTAEQGSFARAAKETYCSSVSVMNHINQLETELGIRLFDRTNHGVKLTAAGRSFYEDVLEIKSLLKRAVRKAQQIETLGKKVIRVGTSILRPCRELIDLWEQSGSDRSQFQIILIPFDDDPIRLKSVLEERNGIDCFAAPCDPVVWQDKYNIRLIRQLPCRIGVPKRHPLSLKESLTWDDLRGEKIILVKQGLSVTLERLRDDIMKHHPEVGIIDTDGAYTLDTFNFCDQMNCLIETLDIWADVHPSLVTLPMEWEHTSPYGIMYSKDPSPSLQEFIDIISESIRSSLAFGKEGI